MSLSLCVTFLSFLGSSSSRECLWHVFGKHIQILTLLHSRQLCMYFTVLFSVIAINHVWLWSIYNVAAPDFEDLSTKNEYKMSPLYLNY